MTPHLHSKLQAWNLTFPLKILLQITFLDFRASFWAAHCPEDPDWGHSPRCAHWHRALELLSPAPLPLELLPGRCRA